VSKHFSATMAPTWSINELATFHRPIVFRILVGHSFPLLRPLRALPLCSLSTGCPAKRPPNHLRPQTETERPAKQAPPPGWPDNWAQREVLFPMATAPLPVTLLISRPLALLWAAARANEAADDNLLELAKGGPVSLAAH